MNLLEMKSDILHENVLSNAIAIRSRVFYEKVVNDKKKVNDNNNNTINRK